MKLAALKRFRYFGLILVGLVVAYVAADLLWWRYELRNAAFRWFPGPTGDPFSTNTTDPSFLSELPEILDQHVFINLALQYHLRKTWGSWRDPFRHESDPQGRAYFSGEQEIPEIERFPGILHCANEPSIDAIESETPRMVRLTIHPWSRNPRVWSVRKNRDKRATLHAVEIDRNTGKVLKNSRFSVGENTWAELIRRQEESTFWETMSEKKWNQNRGTDGEIWLFETNLHGSHQKVLLWTPTRFLDSKPRRAPTGRNYANYVAVFELLGSEHERQETRAAPP